MINPIGPQTSVEIAPAANDSSGRPGTPARARGAASSVPGGASKSSASVLKAKDTARQTEKDFQNLIEAAQEFESLLLAQILKTTREAASGGWLGAGGGAATGSTMQLAETQLARAMAQRGALGIGKLLAKEMAPQTSLGTSIAADGGAEKAAAMERGDPETSAGPFGERVAAETSGIPDRPVAPRPRVTR